MTHMFDTYRNYLF